MPQVEIPAAAAVARSDIRSGAFGLSDRVLVAGGGGGHSSAGVGGQGGAGGGLTGNDGSDGPPSGFDLQGGGGGTQTTGGTAGLGDQGGRSGLAGSFGDGGQGWDPGSSGIFTFGAGGGGGGGWYGGGGGAGCLVGGCVGAGGGGGSGFGPAGTVFTNGTQSGNGKVVISYVGRLRPDGDPGPTFGSWRHPRRLRRLHSDGNRSRECTRRRRIRGGPLHHQRRHDCWLRSDPAVLGDGHLHHLVPLS